MEGNTENIATILEPLKTALTSSISPSDIISVLASVVGIGMTFVLMWFGVRKLKTIFTSAVTKGKLKI